MAATYYAQILRWDWDAIVRRSRSAAYHRPEKCPEDCYGDEHVGYAFLGKVTAIAPSGKYYTPNTTHQTGDDVERDSRWEAALDRAAKRFGGYIDIPDGHDLDELFFACYWSKAQLD